MNYTHKKFIRIQLDNYKNMSIWDNAVKVNELPMIGQKKREPVIDKMVSKIVGRDILANDPRLIRFVVEWKQKNGSSETTDTMDNFNEDPEFRRELIKLFNPGHEDKNVTKVETKKND